tara:strand:- start:321 stop:794 length:474 start_codon:yes stop_codon:yes gene_type:complete
MSVISKSTPSVILNKTFTYKLEDYAFGDLPTEKVIEIFKDGRVFSHFIEHWIETKYPLKHISGCKSYDFIDINNPEIHYDEKTFTKKGCNFCPSNMLGQGRKFDEKIFVEKSNKLIFCIVSNINFPEIKMKFVNGGELVKLYPKGKISVHDYVKFFD